MRIYNFFRYSFHLFFRHDLWKINPIIPILRFIFLQTFFLIGFKRYNFVWINKLLLPIHRGEMGLTGNYYFGLHEFNDMAFVLHSLRKDELFVDVGANLGSYSLLASGVVGARSLAFEPVPSSYHRMKENIEINKLDPLINLKMIALTSPEKLSNKHNLLFSIDKDTENSFVDLSYRGKKISIPASTLDNECQNLDPTLIKIDVEGHEFELLKGAINTLNKSSLLAVIIESQSQEVAVFMGNFGFSQFEYDGHLRELSLPKEYRVNQIWIKNNKITQVKDRLIKAIKNNVLKKSF